MVEILEPDPWFLREGSRELEVCGPARVSPRSPYLRPSRSLPAYFSLPLSLSLSVSVSPSLPLSPSLTPSFVLPDQFPTPLPWPWLNSPNVRTLAVPGGERVPALRPHPGRPRLGVPPRGRWPEGSGVISPAASRVRDSLDFLPAKQTFFFFFFLGDGKREREGDGAPALKAGERAPAAAALEGRRLVTVSLGTI